MTFDALIRRARGSATAPLAGAVLLVIAAAATAQTAAPQAPRLEPLEGAYVATARVNVRQQPSAQAPRVGQIESGATVRVTGKVAGAPWYAVVQDNGAPGFVSADLLRATPAQAPVAAAPAPVAAAATAPAADDAALKEQLAKIEGALSELNRQMPSAKELESLSAAVKGLLEREQKRLAEEAAPAAEPKPAAAPDGPSIAERMTKLQEQIAQQIAEQKAEFGRLSDKIESVESSVQPLIDWAKGLTSKAGPAADSAQSWLYTTYASVRDWLLGWIPGWSARPQPDANTPQRT
ncbi:MAG TPA: SH3 domain-containing protein [Azospirillum sp.]|nr:SH3 domain-containing protein [Azospirillum sp.]